MQKTKYVHGYSNREATRLNDQANTLDEIIHNDSLFARNSVVLEAGCGVGAQTKIIAAKNPHTNFVSVDISEKSVFEAESLITSLGINNVEFKQADIYNLPFEDKSFDSVFVCFVLEHLSEPLKALGELKRVLKKGGTIMVIEGDHGTTFFYPDSKYAHMTINCQVQLQKQNGGNSNIGRELYPLLYSAGFSDVIISPRMVYIDAGKPQLVEGFIKNTFTAMIEGVENDSIHQGLINSETFRKGISDLYRTSEPDGVFSYTFFKGFGLK
jgi:ubiquinone/menaquinone biosynthesis C-methylase UbiE